MCSTLKVAGIQLQSLLYNITNGMSLKGIVITGQPNISHPIFIPLALASGPVKKTPGILFYFSSVLHHIIR